MFPISRGNKILSLRDVLPFEINDENNLLLIVFMTAAGFRNHFKCSSISARATIANFGSRVQFIHMFPFWSLRGSFINAFNVPMLKIF